MLCCGVIYCEIASEGYILLSKDCRKITESVLPLIGHSIFLLKYSKGVEALLHGNDFELFIQHSLFHFMPFRFQLFTQCEVINLQCYCFPHCYPVQRKALNLTIIDINQGYT